MELSNVSSAPKKRQKREEYRDNSNEASYELPKKKFYRQRAHANPFSDHSLVYPVGPSEMNWSSHYPAFTLSDPVKDFPDNCANRLSLQLVKDVEVADIGCGFGGLLFALASKLPNTLMIGLEIRISVAEFVYNKIRALRQQELHLQIKPMPTDRSKFISPYQNISVLRANTMKFLPNFFHRNQLSKIFLCFPDPHFKTRKHKARIVSSTLNSEYAYVLRPGGVVYTITDVEDLHIWMAEHFDGHGSFKRVDEHELEADGDVCISVMKTDTEEGKKVERFGGKKLVACWERVEDPPWPE